MGSDTTSMIILSDAVAYLAVFADAWYTNADVRPCLIGDSIGVQWFSLLPEIFRAPEWRTVVLTKSACAMVDEDYFYSRMGQIYTVCTEWRNAVPDYLESLQPDIVFLGSAAAYEFSEKQWTDGATRVLARLTAVAGHVIDVPDTSTLSFDGPGCLARHTPTAHEPVITEASICREALMTTQAADVARYLDRPYSTFQTPSCLTSMIWSALEDTVQHKIRMPRGFSG